MVSGLRRIPWLPAAVVGLGAFVLLVPFARLDFDPHHDGYVLAAAIGVHEGLRVHTDVFAQYGPILPWLQGAALFLPFGPALDLRLLNTALLAVSVFLMADLGRVAPKNWPISRWTGWWAAVAWFLLSDIWLYSPMLPWSSTVAIVLTLLMLGLVGRGIRRRDLHDQAWARFDFFAAGALCPILFFTRINVASALLLGILALAIVGHKSLWRNRGLLISASVGGVVAAGVITGAMYIQGALPEYAKQAILYPFGYHVGVQASSSVLYPYLWALIQQFPAVLLIAVAVLCVRRLGSRTARVLTGTLAGCLVVAYENRRIVTEPTFDGWWSRLTSPNDVFLTGTQQNLNYLYLVVALTLTSCMALVFAALLTWRRTRELPAGSIRWGFLIALTLAGLAQTVPTWDARHVWWGIPIGVLLVSATTHALLGETPGRANYFSVIMLAVAIMACLSAWNYLQVARVEVKSGYLVQGMRIDSDLNDRLKRELDLQRESIPEDSEVLYLHPDGYTSVIDGSWRSMDRYFVSWGPSSFLTDRLASADVVVVQKGSLHTWEEQLSASGFRLRASSPETAIYWSQALEDSWIVSPMPP